MDEIMQVLDDNSMNLQSMSASPFIGPFMAKVRKWENLLTFFSEIIEEWLATQRKWLYLEGIFVGGDIREQLPDEARKFDDIDKAFRRVKLDFSLMRRHGDSRREFETFLLLLSFSSFFHVTQLKDNE